MCCSTLQLFHLIIASLTSHHSDTWSQKADSQAAFFFSLLFFPCRKQMCCLSSRNKNGHVYAAEVFNWLLECDVKTAEKSFIFFVLSQGGARPAPACCQSHSFFFFPLLQSVNLHKSIELTTGLLSKFNTH